MEAKSIAVFENITYTTNWHILQEKLAEEALFQYVVREVENCCVIYRTGLT